MKHKLINVSRWDKNDEEIDGFCFHTRIPFWVFKLIAKFIQVPAPHQRNAKSITLYATYHSDYDAGILRDEVILWRRRP